MKLSLGLSLRDYSVAGGVTYDADALAFFTAASITDTTQKNAVNQLVLDLKSASIWTKMKALYPVVGGVASAHAVNLKTPGTYNLTFQTGWTHSSTGMTPNGATYADTFLNANALLNLQGHITYYSRTATISTTEVDIGSNEAGSPNRLLMIVNDSTVNAMYYGSSLITVQETISDKKGLIINNKLNTTSLKYYRNGNLRSTNTSLNTVSAPNLNIYLGARNSDGTANFYSSKQCAFASIGDGLTDAEASAFYTAVQTFQTTLGRQV